MNPPQKQFPLNRAASEKLLATGSHASSGERLVTPARVLKILGHWRYILREQSLRFSQPPPLQTPISWPLDPEQIKHLVVKWPTAYFDSDAEKFIQHVKLGMRRFVRVESSPIPQSYGGVINIELWWREKPYPIAIDISDTMADIQQDILNRSALYFKMQHLRQGYQSDRVLPGGYTNCSMSYYKMLPWLRTVRDRQPARFEVYGRFGRGESKEIRRRAVEILSTQQHFQYTGAFEMVRGSRSLEETALSSICIDLPGKGDFCFRLADYLGIGTCVVAFKHRTNLPVSLEDGKHILFAKEDLSDLAELCRYYMEHPEERRRIARNSREYFDKFLHRDQLAAYYLSKSMERITRS